MSKGPADAAVTVELFADLQSPMSRPAFSVLNELMHRYPSAVRLQFRNFPLPFHAQAGLAHEAAMIAARDGRFWEFATAALDQQDALREPDLIALAGRLGLDETTFAETLRQHRYAPRVDADLQDGHTRGLRGSPVIFVNDKRIDGVPSLCHWHQRVGRYRFRQRQRALCGRVVGGSAADRDPATGVASRDIPVTGGGGNNHLSDLAIDPTTGEFWASRGGSYDGRIVRIDPQTGAVTRILDLAGLPDVTGVSFDIDGVMYAPLNGARLAKVDTVTGALTYIGPGFGGPKIAGLGFER